MIERKELNRLVVATLEDTGESLKAVQLYDLLRNGEHSEVLRQDKVRGFRSFVKVLNQFAEIKQAGSGVKQYSIRKVYITKKG